MTRQARVAIIGSGFTGLGIAIALRRDGIEDFVAQSEGSPARVREVV